MTLAHLIRTRVDIQHQDKQLLPSLPCVILNDVVLQLQMEPIQPDCLFIQADVSGDVPW